MATLTMNPEAPPQPNFTPIIEAAEAKHNTHRPIRFNPAKHLSFAPPPEVFSMEDLGLEGVGVSPVAVSQPFQLFSEEAVEHFRAEVLNPEVMKNCRFQSNLAACQLRGYSPK